MSSVFFDFNEAVDENSLTGSSFLLVYAGPDNRLDTADDSVVTNGVVSYHASINAAVLSFSPALSYGLYRATLSSNITDLAGNRFVTNVFSIFYILPGGPGGDPDNDDLTNAEEIRRGTNPLLADTDGDGWFDGDELDNNSDPLDRKSRPNMTFVAQPPVLIELPSPETFGTSDAGVVLARPPLLLDLPSPDTFGNAGVGVVLAQPPVLIDLPSPETFGTSGVGIVLARPPLLLDLPSPETFGNAGVGVVLAHPPVSIDLPSPESFGASGVGLILAQPPLLIDLPSPEAAGVSGIGLFLALPSVEICLPSPDTFGTSGRGLFLGQPPVNIKIPNQ